MRFKNIDNKSGKKSAGAVGWFGIPQASAAHRDHGRSCVTGKVTVYLHHNAARGFAIDGDVEEDSWVHHFTRRD